MCAVLCFLQLIAGAAGDHFLAMGDVAVQHLLDVHHSWLAVVERQHDHPERVFQLRLLIEIVDDHLGNGVAFQFHDDSQSFLTRFVTQITDPLEFLVVNQMCDLFEEIGLVYVVRDFRDDDTFLAALHFFDTHAATHLDATATRGEVVLDALMAANHPTGREIRSFNQLGQRFQFQLRLVDQRTAGINDLDQVVRWDVGRHPDGDACAAVDQ